MFSKGGHGSGEDDGWRWRVLIVAKLNSGYRGPTGKLRRTNDGFPPSVPTGEVLSLGDDNFIKFEDVGVKEAKNAAFVLIAGGLGERLGYNGRWHFLQRPQLEHVSYNSTLSPFLFFRKLEVGSHKEIPFVIMTSDDIRVCFLSLMCGWRKLLLGALPPCICLQEKVACLDDSDARLTLDPPNKYKIQTKPHGHGDVHSLLYSSGLLNTQMDCCSRQFQLPWESVHLESTMPILLLFHGKQQKLLEELLNSVIVMNQLDPLLRATGHPNGDVNCETGYSPFPVNINQSLVHTLKSSAKQEVLLRNSYKDASKTSFKSSTRLECMMQDDPKTLPPSAKVRFTVPKGNPYHNATSGEMAIYLILKKVSMRVSKWRFLCNRLSTAKRWKCGHVKPKCGIIKSKVSGSCSISRRSTIALKGRDILDGALIINSTDGAEVKVGGSIKNKGWLIERINYKDTAFLEKLRVRGFRMEETYSQPGKYTLKP
ncbi:UDP-sugar pyrophosphorylase-like [Gossypium australe]|uniref:UDP-sugar pyrophosphorylase-like n=1 Tax=Gossypium australe TaxID=47621 RepID=A0A5B6WVT5_9ROSI|nr:UDP-sugar pyrophosphorylase-like [Gossypium australe]